MAQISEKKTEKTKIDQLVNKEMETIKNQGGAIETPSEETPEFTNVIIKGAFLSEIREGKFGDFYNVSIPQGTKLNGAIDIGGYQFSASEQSVRPYPFDDNSVEIGKVRDKPMEITKSVQQMDGTYETKKMMVKPDQLKTALNKQYHSYKAHKQTEREVEKSRDQSTPAKDQSKAEKSARARSKSADKPDPVKKK